MTVLLTGATGFIGRHVLDLLARSQVEVVALTRSAPPAALAGRAAWVRQDLAAPLDRAALPGRVRTVVHLAQSDRYRDFPAGVDDVVALNVASTAALADYARRVGAERFVLCSTGGVYGYREGPVREQDAVAPASFYQASKYAAEVLLEPYRGLLEVVVLRPFFVYGATQRGMLVAGLAQRVLAGEQITVDGDPGLRLNPTHVSDAARALVAAIDADPAPGIVNVAGDEAVTLTDLVRGLARAAAVEPAIVHAGDGPPGDLLGDNARMRDALGVAPRVGIEEGLRDVVDELRAG